MPGAGWTITSARCAAARCTGKPSSRPTRSAFRPATSPIPASRRRPRRCGIPAATRGSSFRRTGRRTRSSAGCRRTRPPQFLVPPVGGVVTALSCDARPTPLRGFAPNIWMFEQIQQWFRRWIRRRRVEQGLVVSRRSVLERKENNQSKYDRSHADEINETYTFSFTVHFILPRSEPKVASPFLY